MSGNGLKIPYSRARAIMVECLEFIRPHALRAEPAGSLRRMRREVGDLDIVAIPKPIYNLFNEPLGTEDHQLNGLDWSALGGEILQDGPKKKKIKLPDITLELNIVTPPAQWGVIYLLRTGPGDFSHAMVTERSVYTKTGRTGLMPGYLHFRDGSLWRGSYQINTPEESDVFSAFDMTYIPPERRK